jgi:hypothetical protein
MVNSTVFDLGSTPMFPQLSCISFACSAAAILIPQLMSKCWNLAGNRHSVPSAVQRFLHGQIIFHIPRHSMAWFRFVSRVWILFHGRGWLGVYARIFVI